MPDRLEDLRRQRALVQEQLAWLDREIAALVPTPPPSSSPAPSLAAPPAAMPQAVPLVPETPLDLAAYEVDAVATQADTRRGCLLYAAGAIALFFAALVVIYFVAYRDRPLFFVDRSSPNNLPAEKSPPPAQPGK